MESLKGKNVLIIGATGDIGLACTHYLKSKVKKLLLCARNNIRLDKLSQELTNYLLKSTSLHFVVVLTSSLYLLNYQQYLMT